MTKSYDIIIVGGGSSACAAAYDLVRSGRVSVLMIEAGKRARDPWMNIPGTFVKALQKGVHTRMYHSAPEPQINNQQYAIPVGYVLGGGSAVNVMNYQRGGAADYADWVEMGCDGWSYDEVLPVFRRQETNTTFGDSDYHGGDGPLIVSDVAKRNPLSEQYLEAALAAGYSRNFDFNGETQKGFGYFQGTMGNGIRSAAQRVFLKPLARSENFDLMTEAKVQKVNIENGVARSVLVAHKGEMVEIACHGEILIAAGAFASPQILQASGIGPRAVLQGTGVEMVRESPGVGENFMDHTMFWHGIVLNQKLGYYRQDQGLNAVKNGLEYLATRKGVLASFLTETGGFVDTTGQDGRPDAQIITNCLLPAPPPQMRIPEYGFNSTVQCARPKSRGHIHITSGDGSRAPVWVSGVLTDRYDIDVSIRGMRILRDILEQQPMRALRKRIHFPPTEDWSDEGLEAYLRATPRTSFHPSGTVRMGAENDDRSPLDPRLRVKGVRGLRVIDLSTIPQLVAGNTNAPAMMIGGRAADFVLQDL